jgi:hypothetical protein
MSEVFYTVRKQGAIKVKTKEQAFEIVEGAKKAGYNFTARKFGWNWIIEDNDN